MSYQFMKNKNQFMAACLGLLISPIRLQSETLTFTASAAATSVPNVTVRQTNYTQIDIQTNVVAQILHLHQSINGAQGDGYLTIRANGLDFTYTEITLNSAGNNMPSVIGPATITLTAVIIINTVTQGTFRDNMICTISTTKPDQFTPNSAVVVPADSAGPVSIILESSVDMVNWIPANPGTYGTTTTNRFFRVRATR